MNSMTSRERVMAALSRKEPDRVPLDLGGCIASTIIVPAYENLKSYLDLQHETRYMWKRSRTVMPDETVLQRLDIDTRALFLGDYRGGASKLIDEDTFIDAWSTTWKKAPDGHFINVEGPFQNRDPKLEDLETFNWPDPDNPGLYEGLRDSVEALRKNNEFAIVLNLPVGIVHQCQFMRGFADWLIDLHQSPQYACRMMDLIADVWIRIAQNALSVVGDLIDVIMWGDDLAMQEATLMRPKIYRELIKPRHLRMMDALKSRSAAKILYHSCGAVYALIEDLIEIGIDALNPVQVSARNMDPLKLKTEFGDRLAFWGAIDTHKILPFGTPETVREEVKRIIDTMGKGGGYILASVHNIQREVPPENICAMFDEGKNYGRYSR